MKTNRKLYSKVVQGLDAKGEKKINGLNCMTLSLMDQGSRGLPIQFPSQSSSPCIGFVSHRNDINMVIQREWWIRLLIEMRFSWKIGTHKTLSRTKIEDNRTWSTRVMLARALSDNSTVLVLTAFQVVSNSGLQTIWSVAPLLRIHVVFLPWEVEQKGYLKVLHELRDCSHDLPWRMCSYWACAKFVDIALG